MVWSAGRASDRIAAELGSATCCAVLIIMVKALGSGDGQDCGTGTGCHARDRAVHVPPRVLSGASVTHGVFALVLGLLAFLYITATAVVHCVEAKVVRDDHLHPRRLLTPFTDDVDLSNGPTRLPPASQRPTIQGFRRCRRPLRPTRQANRVTPAEPRRTCGA